MDILTGVNVCLQNEANGQFFHPVGGERIMLRGYHFFGQLRSSHKNAGATSK